MIHQVVLSEPGWLLDVAVSQAEEVPMPTVAVREQDSSIDEQQSHL